MHSQVIKPNKFCLNKHLLKENQVQEKRLCKKFINWQCCDRLKQMKSDVFGNAEVRYIF